MLADRWRLAGFSFAYPAAASPLRLGVALYITNRRCCSNYLWSQAALGGACAVSPRNQAVRITAQITRVPGEIGPGLVVLADALLLLTGDPTLDEAVKIAHNFNILKAQRQSRRRALEHAASTLRDQLLAVEHQMHEAA